MHNNSTKTNILWGLMIYGVKTWTLRREDERSLEAMEMWIWRGILSEERLEEVMLKLTIDGRVMGMWKRKKGCTRWWIL